MNVLLNVYICLFRKTSAPSFHERTVKVLWCYFQSKNFSRTSDTIRHLKTLKIISNEMQVFLSCVDDILVLCRCIQRDFFMFTFISRCFSNLYYFFSNFKFVINQFLLFLYFPDSWNAAIYAESMLPCFYLPEKKVIWIYYLLLINS